MTFDETIATRFDRLGRDRTHIFKARIDPIWVIGAAPHGGYASCILLSACKHSLQRSPDGTPLTGDGRFPDPVSANFVFLAPARFSKDTGGDVEVEVGVLRTGGRMATVEATLTQDQRARGAAEAKIVVCIKVLATFGTLSPQATPDVPFSMIANPPPSIPSPDECRRLAPPRKSRLTGFTVVSRPDTVRVDYKNAERVDWIKFNDETTPFPIAFSLFCDAYAPPPYVHGFPLAQYWFPTTDYHVQFRRWPETPPGGWFLVHGVTRYVTEGRFESDCVLWELTHEGTKGDVQDEQGRSWRVLAVARQMMLIVPFQKQLGSGLSEEEKKAEAKRREEGAQRRRERVEREKKQLEEERKNGGKL
ncbi:hypothetical protein M427DRAFT_50862 [Gonapodya prolifera JEL478]|uniref:Thioesterase/thiol ester dehydrase-isomerase n=1 Tax=Gonapodya prolifera (strain JEL478) TaxID=1344416 RepID=A0A139B0Q8_GONPJ|nr:hypothetical protein M427DRAFT_50862 [Gonapodya prolifera JEL478]|eukprot:KXS22564.1 hypothetical protein M427DRAFT_50862 [Gonapodya prolifera JEL478]